MTDRQDHAKPELPDFDDEAIDLALVHADDEYLDLLAGSRLTDRDSDLGGLGEFDDVDEFGDEQLTQLLMSWRHDVDSEPLPALVDPKLATVTVAAARMRKKHRPRLLVPLAAAAAVLAIAFAGVGLAARGAQPGDTLWALTKVLYAEHARSVEAADAVRADLREAQDALTQGNVAEAKSKLEDAHAALPTVSGEDGKDDLEAQHAALLAQLPGNPSSEAGPPPSPDPSTQTDPGTGSSDDTDTASDTPSSDPDQSQSSSSPSSSETTDPPSSSDPTTETSSRSDPGTGTPGETGGTNGAQGFGVESVPEGGDTPVAAPDAAPVGN